MKKVSTLFFISILLTTSSSAFAQQADDQAGCGGSSSLSPDHRQLVEAMKIRLADKQFEIDEEGDEIGKMQTALNTAKVDTAGTWTVTLGTIGFSLLQELKKKMPRPRVLLLPQSLKAAKAGRSIASALSAVVAGITTADLLDTKKQLEQKHWDLETRKALLVAERRAAEELFAQPNPNNGCPGQSTSSAKSPLTPYRRPAIVDQKELPTITGLPLQ